MENEGEWTETEGEWRRISVMEFYMTLYTYIYYRFIYVPMVNHTVYVYVYSMYYKLQRQNGMQWWRELMVVDSLATCCHAKYFSLLSTMSLPCSEINGTIKTSWHSLAVSSPRVLPPPREIFFFLIIFSNHNTYSSAAKKYYPALIWAQNSRHIICQWHVLGILFVFCVNCHPTQASPLSGTVHCVSWCASVSSNS